MSPPQLPGDAAALAIVAASGMTWSCLMLAIRIFLRACVNGPFRWDDACCIAATSIGIVYSSLTLVSVHVGLGQQYDTLPSPILDKLLHYNWVTSWLYIAAQTFSILSVLFLICRITKASVRFVLTYSIMVATAIWCIVALFMVGLGCDFPHLWDTSPPARCIDRWRMWLGIIITRLGLEVSTLILLTLLVWTMHMPRRFKFVAIAAFALRLLIIPPEVVRLLIIHDALRDLDARTRVRGALFRISLIKQVVVHLSIILATLPCAKPFLSVLEWDGFRAPHTAERTPSTTHGFSLSSRPSCSHRMTPETAHTLGSHAGNARRGSRLSAGYTSSGRIPGGTVTTIRHSPLEDENDNLDDDVIDAEQRRDSDRSIAPGAASADRTRWDIIVRTQEFRVTVQTAAEVAAEERRKAEIAREREREEERRRKEGLEVEQLVVGQRQRTKSA